MIEITVYSRLYDTYESAHVAFQKDARNDDYVLSIKRSKYYSITKLKDRVVLVCDRNDIYKLKKNDRERDVTSIKCDCSHRLNLQHSKTLNKWEIIAMNKTHNHESTRIFSHVAHRQNEMNEKFIEYVDRTTSSNKTENQICQMSNNVNDLTNAKSFDIWINWRKDHSDTTIQMKNIYNAKTKIRQRRLDLYTFTQTLLKVLHRDNWFVKILLNEISKRVRRLFFVNKLCKKILCKNSEIIIMNCIYKINKYDMSMLVIMNHIFLYSNFYIDFAFIEIEEKENFVWILEQLKALYQALDLIDFHVIVIDRNLILMKTFKFVYFLVYHLLCLWHINKNILKNCKLSFETQKQWKKFLIAWYRVVYALTKEKCQKIWKKLTEKYEKNYIDECDYIYEIWLVTWVKRFCKFYINKIWHFDICTTFRVESDHRILKIKLKCSTDDLMIVIDDFETMLINQHESYLHDLDVIKMKISINLSKNLMRNLLSRVISYALDKIRKQYKLLRKIEKNSDKYFLKHCTNVFWYTMSLSCAHRIKERMKIVEDEAKKLILEDDVHFHWRFTKLEYTFCTSTQFESDISTT